MSCLPESRGSYRDLLAKVSGSPDVQCVMDYLTDYVIFHNLPTSVLEEKLYERTIQLARKAQTIHRKEYEIDIKNDQLEQIKKKRDCDVARDIKLDADQLNCDQDRYSGEVGDLNCAHGVKGNQLIGKCKALECSFDVMKEKFNETHERSKCWESMYPGEKAHTILDEKLNEVLTSGDKTKAIRLFTHIRYPSEHRVGSVFDYACRSDLSSKGVVQETLNRMLNRSDNHIQINKVLQDCVDCVDGVDFED